jgi:hypothetical protein
VIGAISVGSGTILFNIFIWFTNQYALSLYYSEAISSLALQFFSAQALASIILLIGVIYLFKFIHRRVRTEIDLLAIISRALDSKKSVKIGILSAIVYALIYSFTSSIIVYQPEVDFARVYGVTEPSWDAIACCGPFGTIPKLILYPLPQFHLGIQIIPLNALFLIIIPVLFGFNITLASYALMNSPLPRTGRWLTTLGATVGLFTACPTCAGFFLASAVGGIGATTLAIALASYQALFILISIPALALSPLIMATMMKSSLLSACDIKDRINLQR